MKEIQHMSMPAEFTIGGVGKVENVAVNRLLTQLKKGLQRFWIARRELLLAVAATCTISLSVLVVSYLFFIQLATHGW